MSEPPVTLGAPPDQNKSTLSTDSGETVYLNEQQCNSVMAYLKRQREKGIYCDMEVLCGNENESINVHGCVMAANSRHLATVIDEQTMQHRDSQTTESKMKLKMPSDNYRAVASLIDYMYSGQLGVSVSTAKELLQLSEKYEMSDIKHCCEIHLEKNIDINNWKQVWQWSCDFSLGQLQLGVEKYLVENFYILSDGQEILDVSFAFLQKPLSNCNSNKDCDTELCKMKVIFRWLQYKLLERMEFCTKLLTMIDTDLLFKDSVNKMLLTCFHENVPILKNELVSEFLKKLKDKPINELKNNSHSEKNQTCNDDSETTSDNGLDSKEIHLNPEETDNSKVSMVYVDIKPKDTKQNEIKSDSDETLSLEILETKTKIGKVENQKNDLEEKTVVTHPKLGVRTSRRKAAHPIKIPAKRPKRQVLAPYKIRKERQTVSPKRNKPGIKTGKSQNIPANRKRKRGRKKIVKEIDEDSASEADDWNETEIIEDEKEVKDEESKPIQGRKKRAKKTDSAVQTYQCPKCPRTFSTKSQLNHHQKGHGSETPFLCEICGFSTRHFGSMNVHRKQHNGKKLKCPMAGCTYEAIRKSRLDDHINGHEGIKNHVCSICGKAFTARKHLHRHEKIHVDIKPLACDCFEGCLYRTTRQDKLKEHIKKHHPESAIQKGYLLPSDLNKPPLPPRPRKRKPKKSQKPEVIPTTSVLPQLPVSTSIELKAIGHHEEIPGALVALSLPLSQNSRTEGTPQSIPQPVGVLPASLPGTSTIGEEMIHYLAFMNPDQQFVQLQQAQTQQPVQTTVVTHQPIQTVLPQQQQQHPQPQQNQEQQQQEQQHQQQPANWSFTQAAQSF